MLAVVVCGAWSGCWTYVILKLMNFVSPVRVSEAGMASAAAGRPAAPPPSAVAFVLDPNRRAADELRGIDVTDHGEFAYHKLRLGGVRVPRACERRRALPTRRRVQHEPLFDELLDELDEQDGDDDAPGKAAASLSLLLLSATLALTPRDQRQTWSLRCK